jgi:hypothetical protein
MTMTDEPVFLLPKARFEQEGIEIVFMLDSSEPADLLKLRHLLRMATYVATGRRGSDVARRRVIPKEAWDRLEIVGDGSEGVVQDKYDNIYFDVLLHPTLAAAEQAAGAKNQPTREAENRRIAAGILRANPEITFENFKKLMQEQVPISGRQCWALWRQLEPSGGRKPGPKKSNHRAS